MSRIFYFLFIFSLSCLTMQAQNTIKVNGTVVDYLSLKPLKNVLIGVKNSLTSTYATTDGKFTVEVNSPYSVLVVSFPGYQAKEFPLSGRKEVSITLVPEGIDAGESIVRLPYSTSNSKALNGAYTVIQNRNDKYRDIYQMLQGTVPGLESNANSGTPGEGAKFNLRGIRSLYTTNEPLVVVDGTPINNLNFTGSIVNGNLYNYLSDINVKDIESVTVLRDVSAAGIYGSHAANGAIVITTKGGTNGKTFLDVSIQRGISSRFKEIPMMSTAEYLPYLSGKLYGQGLDYQTINTRFPFFAFTPGSAESVPYSNNTDWQKEITRIANTTDFHLDLRGGDATSKYAFSVGYNNTEGSIQETSSSSITSRFNLDFKILKNFSAGTRISFTNTTKKLMDQGYEERVNPLYLSFIKPPVFSPFIQLKPGVNSRFYTLPAFDNLSNPMAVVKGVSNDIQNYWILTSVYAKYNFNNNLNTKLMISLDRRGLQEDRFTPAWGIVPLNFDLRYDRTAEKQVVNRQTITIEHTLNYEKELNAGNRIQAFGGYNLEIANYSSGYGFARHSTDDQYQEISDGTRVTSSGLEEKYNNVSAFFNGEYTFRQKLFLKMGVRAEGSSKFGKDVDKGLLIASFPFAVLPYSGLTWKVKSEPWMNKIDFLSEFNLRTSWGITANQDIPVNTQYTLYNKTFNGPYTGLVLTNIGNSKIKWETTRSANAGVDISLFKNGLNFSVDYFNNTTDDLLVPKRIAGMNGQTFYWDNEGSIRNTGFEVSAVTRGHWGDLIWNLNVNFAKYQNKILSLYNNAALVDGVNGYTSIAKVGSPVGLIYGYKYLGVFNTTDAASGLKTDKGVPYQGGDYQFQNVNGDEYINDLDMQVIGNSNPEFYGGITSNITYKKFSIEGVFTYVYGNEILNVLRSKLENGSGYENQSRTALSRWMADGDVATIANTIYGDPSGNIRPSSLYIEDGSYLKLKSLTLSYDINKKIGFARSFQLYVTGYNLFTLTNYSGLDPEIAIGENAFSRGYDFGNVPQARSFMLGVKIGL